MGNLTPLTRAYLLGVYIAGACALAASQLVAFPATHATILNLAIFLILAVITGDKKVNVSLRRTDTESGSMSLGFALTFASMLVFGPGPAVLVSAASSLSSCLFPKRQALYQMSFNVFLGIVETLMGSLAFVILNGWDLKLQSTESFIAVIAAAFTYFIVNTFGVATIIALCSTQKLLAVWKESFLWTGASYLATASISAFAVYLLRDNLTGILICVAPVVFLAYQSYHVYISRAEEKQHHIADLQSSQENLASLYLAIIKSLALAIDAKDTHTHQHIIRVQRYSVAIAKEMGLAGDDLEVINTGALLHDIGKLGVPEYVLLKPGRLTREEFDMIKKHPEIGAAILSPVEFPWPVLAVVRHHHEKWDGSGYPDGLRGEDIPLCARIMAVADVYDALTSSRSYRRAWSHERTVETIKKDVGTHFDAKVVEAFARIIDDVVREMARNGEGPLATTPPVLANQARQTERTTAPIASVPSELVPLFEMTDHLAPCLGMEDVSQLLSKKIANLFPGSLTAVLLTQDGDPPLKVSSARGVNESYFHGATTISIKSRSALVLLDQQPFLGEFDYEDLMMAGNETAPWADLRECMIAPLTFEGVRLGTVNIYGSEAAALSQDDLGILQLVAERAGCALYNGYLFDRLHRKPSSDIVQDATPTTEMAPLAELADFVKLRCSQKTSPGSMDATGLAVLAIEVPNFESVSEVLGLVGGEEVMKTLGRRFAAIVQPHGLVAQAGRSKFIAAIEVDTSTGATACADRITCAVEELDLGIDYLQAGANHWGTCIGMACRPDDGDDWASLIAGAYRDARRIKSERELPPSFTRAA